MNVLQTVAPTIEPVSIAEVKLHLRLDSETLAGNLAAYTSLAAGSHAIANNYTTHVGTAVEVIGKQAVVYLRPVNNGAGGTVDTKIQESDDGTTWTDVTSGAFTQVTEANDTTIQEKEYTGAKRYIRTASKVLVAACEFGTDVIVNAATTAEDDLLTAIIQASREHIEDITRRALLTQTWYYYLDGFPSDKDYIVLPFGNLQSVTSIKYKDSGGTETTMAVTTDYLVETNGEGYGRIVLPYGGSWPSATLYPSNPITIEFVCGWTAAASIPKKIKAACLMLCAKLYASRGEDIIGQSVVEDKTVERLLASSRLWEEFE
jgi:uncharacterized phiE125 gp8 family phage protein